MADFDPVQLAQALEQLETVAAEVAQLMYSYYEDLCESGFSEEQAFSLTQIFSRLWWARMLPQQR